MNKPIVLTFVAYYLPGYKFGGPVRTIANMVDQLGEQFDFRIVTLDRDALDTEPYPDIKVNAWNQVGAAQVYYASPGALTLANIARLIRDTPHDVLYLNSFFSAKFTILPLLARRLGMLPAKPVVLAPRGEFSQGALVLKQRKKKLFLALARTIGLYRGLIWQASSAHEEQDILRAVGPKIARQIIIAPDLPPKLGEQPTTSFQPRQPGEPLRVVFLSRISPKKNLDYALRVLARVSVPVIFDIYGVVDDEKYWQRCRHQISQLSESIKVNFYGALPHQQVGETLSEYDLFFLPTRGENYGHVIAEALTEGVPVLISDQTPWRGLAKNGVGHDLPLADERNFCSVIEQQTMLESSEIVAQRQATTNYAYSMLRKDRVIKQNVNLFVSAAEVLHA